MKNDILNQLQKHNLIDHTAGWKLVPASGGLNSTVFLASNPAGEPQFTVRVPQHHCALNLEFDVLNILKECKGVPQDVAMLNDSMLVHAYLPGQPQPLAEVGMMAITNLARLLACIHAHEADWYTIWPSTEHRVGSRADSYRARLPTLREYVSFQEPLDQLLHDRILTIYRQLHTCDLSEPTWRQRTFEQRHGDLSYGNIIWQGDTVGLVDWEYARVGDAAEDIAYLLTEQPLDSYQVTALKTAYLNFGGDISIWDRVPHYQPFTALGAALWWMDYLISIGENPTESVEVLERLERAESQQIPS